MKLTFKIKDRSSQCIKILQFFARHIYDFENQGQYSNPYLSLAKYLAKSFTWLSTLLKSYSNAKMKLFLNLAKIDDVVRKVRLLLMTSQ